MGIAKLSSKGQIVLPKAIRDARSWREGTEFIVEDRAGALRPSANDFHRLCGRHPRFVLLPVKALATSDELLFPKA